MDLGSLESLFLKKSCFFDDMDEFLRRQLSLLILDFTDFDPGHLDEYIHTVEYRARET